MVRELPGKVAGHRDTLQRIQSRFLAHEEAVQAIEAETDIPQLQSDVDDLQIDLASVEVDVAAVVASNEVHQERLDAAFTIDNPEIDTGMKWVGGETVYRKGFTGIMPNATTLDVAHGIVGLDVLVDVFGQMTGSGVRTPLPFTSTTALNSATITVDATNFSVITGFDYSLRGFRLFLEYTKSA